MILFLDFNFSVDFVKCSSNESVLSSVTPRQICYLGGSMSLLCCWHLVEGAIFASISPVSPSLLSRSLLVPQMPHISLLVPSYRRSRAFYILSAM